MSKKKSLKKRSKPSDSQHVEETVAATELDASEENRDPLLSRKDYDRELKRLQVELVKLLESVKRKQEKVCVIFEGRDAAGKGGTIQRISQHLNPRFCRIVALGKPTEREQHQWYFQRYVEQLPTAGEIVLFDRSWYNRAGVEHVMGFCSDAEYQQFLVTCPNFERLLIASGIKLIKYWFSVSAKEQEHRFKRRIADPLRRWKLSPMDLEARAHFTDFSKAKDVMFEHTDTDDSPWFVVDANDKRRARLNCIHHLLSQMSYSEILPPVAELPPRQNRNGYKRPPKDQQRFVPAVY
ncbi:polyphosphate kinase 2 [bacterium]|nr:polyphosphate kinase 2 [bacterium]